MTLEQRVERLKQVYDAYKISVIPRNEWIANQKYEAVAWISGTDYGALGSTPDEAMEHLEAWIAARLSNPDMLLFKE